MRRPRRIHAPVPGLAPALVLGTARCGAASTTEASGEGAAPGRTRQHPEVPQPTEGCPAPEKAARPPRAPGLAK
ncbi:hypothetical protein [Streptomyces smyrnaeus]|uniref:hypothetical protein n=1 Tax=Streptomyces smyrnaeus TaxID=1387713 RepID=UPI0033D8F18C